MNIQKIWERKIEFAYIKKKICRNWSKNYLNVSCVFTVKVFGCHASATSTTHQQLRLREHLSLSKKKCWGLVRIFWPQWMNEQKHATIIFNKSWWAKSMYPTRIFHHVLASDSYCLNWKTYRISRLKTLSVWRRLSMFGFTLFFFSFFYAIHSHESHSNWRSIASFVSILYS